MATSRTQALAERWPPDHPMRARIARYAAYLVLLVVIVAGFNHLRLPVERLPDGMREILLVIGQRMFPPDFGYAADRLVQPFVETFAMAFAGTVLGIVISVPLAWFAAANMTPSPRILYPLVRVLLVIARSIHEIIWAMLLVAILGFGPLAGLIVLTIDFIGFGSKLLAESIESADMKPVEAIRAAGGNRVRQMVMGVVPQLAPVWVGIFVYGWDIVLRASFVLGLVGAGGVGAQLHGAVESLSYERLGAILIIIIAIVVASEAVSAHLRARVR
ncbi:MAG TPA: phosphonate ABC transporter, permease protein PhnE [Burkholderiaceae bacterium]|nr:phosphonate ABC transporter, permease protein PhnE [Burkholderiaceae bacterium]